LAPRLLSYITDMDLLLTFFGSLAEPVRLALMGASLITGAVVLRKLLTRIQHSALTSPAKADASTK
jgi:hypothetical protein